MLRTLRKNRQLLERIDRAIRKLAQDPRRPGSKKLVGSRSDNLCRLRVSAWRILYAVEDERLAVLALELVRRN